MYVLYIANGDTVITSPIFPMYIATYPQVKGQHNRWSFGSRPRTAGPHENSAMPKPLSA